VVEEEEDGEELNFFGGEKMGRLRLVRRGKIRNKKKLLRPLFFLEERENILHATHYCI